MKKTEKADIEYQNKDMASKMVGEALEGKSLAPFGLPNVKIIKTMPTNLPAVESNELRLDHLFLLDDGAVGIIDYESDYSEENFVKYLNYAARVIRRYTKKSQLDRLKSLRIIVIDEECRRNIKEEIEMTQVGKMIFDDGVEAGKKIGIHVGISQGISQGEERKLVKQVCGKLRREKTVEEITEALEEDAEAVEKICAAAALWGPSYDWEKVYETWKKN